MELDLGAYIVSTLSQVEVEHAVLFFGGRNERIKSAHLDSQFPGVLFAIDDRHQMLAVQVSAIDGVRFVTD